MEQDNKDIHIVSYRRYVIVWIGLLLLTGLTISAAGLDLGELNAFVAMVIASLKAILVIAFFMHLLYERGLFIIMVAFTLITLSIFIGFTFFDISFR